MDPHPSIRSTTACTTAPVQADKSSYWAPTLYKYYNGQVEAMTLSVVNTYYLNRGTMPIVAFPAGFRMVAGQVSARGPQSTAQLQLVVSFVCLNYAQGSTQSSTMPQGSCPDGIRAQIVFPSCWDGVNLDSSDHMSHVAYPVGNVPDNGNSCPSTHPKRFMTLFYEFIWSVGPQANGGSLFFSNGDALGFSFHADFMNGWDTNVLQAAINQCTGSLFGNLEACPPFIASLDRTTASNCQVDPDEVTGLSIEQTNGALSTIPGCGFLGLSGYIFNGNYIYAGCGYNPSSYQKTPPNYPSGYQGCYSETTMNGYRSLPKQASMPTGTNTVSACRAACTALGYPIAGLEYGGECWCNSQFSYGTLQMLDTDCYMPCTGNSAQYCGGPNRMSVYSSSSNLPTLTSPPFAPATVSTNYSYLGCYADNTTGRVFPTGASGDSLEKCAASCSSHKYFGMEFSQECYCSNTLTATQISSSSCSMPCASNSANICGGSNALTVYNNTKYTPPVLKLLSGTTGLGCYIDSGSRSLSVQAFSSSSNTPTSCAQACRTKGYKYSGTEYGTECYCDNFLQNAAAAPATAFANNTVGACSMACSGDSTQICGGPNRINIVQDNNWVQSFFTVKQTGKWTFSDCIVDGGPRVLSQGLSVANSTPEKCLAACLAANLPFCGMEYSGECYGSATAPTTATSAPATSGATDPLTRGCSMPCAGNSTVACGGPNRLSYYTYSSTATSVSPSTLQ